MPCAPSGRVLALMEDGPLASPGCEALKILVIDGVEPGGMLTLPQSHLPPDDDRVAHGLKLTLALAREPHAQRRACTERAPYRAQQPIVHNAMELAPHPTGAGGQGGGGGGVGGSGRGSGERVHTLQQLLLRPLLLRPLLLRPLLHCAVTRHESRLPFLLRNRRWRHSPLIRPTRLARAAAPPPERRGKWIELRGCV
jgi:hypothetical protein